MDESHDDLLSTTEAAKLLKKDPRTVLRYAEEGLLPVARRITAHRGARLYLRSDVEALLARMVPTYRVDRGAS